MKATVVSCYRIQHNPGVRTEGKTQDVPEFNISGNHGPAFAHRVLEYSFVWSTA
jgi:hypothetical protein